MPASTENVISCLWDRLAFDITENILDDRNRTDFSTAGREKYGGNREILSLFRRVSYPLVTGNFHVLGCFRRIGPSVTRGNTVLSS